ncbi:DNA-directed RNA polymerase subunit alpha [Candidatus Microgenomates bacterium]|nr:DNA-directed RNA polymerase subunit alpha [Candidatus Microgenomates bacterium]
MSGLKFKVIAKEETPNYGKFSLETLDPGYGHTLGNALRRVLLSSLPGAAITTVRIDGVKHQFTTLKGLKEDILELILNLKKVRVKIYDTDKPVKLILSARGPKKITAADIESPSEAEVMNGDLYLGSLADKSSSLDAELTIERGFGYALAEEHKTGTIGVIPLDAAFSPVTRVNYRVETARLGRMANLDRLVLEIWTDGTIEPKRALEEAAKILVDYFLQIYQPKAVIEEAVAFSPLVSEEILKMTLEELDLPVRVVNSLKNGGIETVGQLLGTSHKDLGKVKNLGGKSLLLIEEKLREKGIALKI